jgi:hypothetical protein
MDAEIESRGCVLSLLHKKDGQGFQSYAMKRSFMETEPS